MFKKSLVILSLLVCIVGHPQVSVNLTSLETPTEDFDISGTIRVQGLPVNNTINAISTFSDGSRSLFKDQKFTAVNTLVTDDNGIIGIVEGLPILELPDQKTIAYEGSVAIVDNNVRINSLVSNTNLAVYLDAQNGSSSANVRFCLLNGITDNVVVNQLKLGSGGGPWGKNQTFSVNLSNSPTPPATLASTVLAYNSNDESIWHKITAEIPSITNGDYILYMISLINTKEVYRLTGVFNNNITGTITSLPKVTFFLERLTNQ